MKYNNGFRAYRFIVFLLLFMFFYHSPPSYAATPQKINYQGYLKNSDIPVDVATNFVFEICDAADCSVSIYCTETANGVTVTKGRFNWLIGTDAACDLTTVPWGAGTLYLRITVNGQVMSPSEEIVSAPYSLDSEYGTPGTTFMLDKDNPTAPGANTSVVFERGTSNANDAMLTWDEAADEFALTSDGTLFATVAMGIATATTYYGDGSNLTGIGGDAVQKTGDDMTGDLEIIQGLATPSLYVEQTGGAGEAGHFEISSGSNGNAALYVKNIGSGDTIYSYSIGDGTAANFQIDNTLSTSTLLNADTNGKGRAASFSVNQTASASDAVYITTNSTTAGGRGLNVVHTGTGGNAGRFENNNASNSNPAVSGYTTGTGNAVQGSTAGTGRGGAFYVNNTSNATDAVFITSNSDDAGSNLLGGNHTGASGTLITLLSGGVEKFEVDKNAVIFVNGSAGASGDVLTSNGAGAAASWQAAGGSCPAGASDNGGTWRWCVDDTPRAADVFINAINNCAGDGGMICDYGEWLAACQANAFAYTQFEEHWINDENGLQSSNTMTSDGATCGTGNMDVGSQTWATTVKYLCCFNK